MRIRENTVLWIKNLCFTRTISKELSVEVVGIFENAPCFDIIGILDLFFRDTIPAQVVFVQR